MIKVPLAKFEETFAHIVQSKLKCVMLFTSDPDEQGVYWCPDCERVAPSYPEMEAEAAKAGLPFYKFLAGDRATWKNPEHVFRKNPLLKVSSVPTFGLFNGKRLVNALVEDEAAKKDQRHLLYQNSSL